MSDRGDNMAGRKAESSHGVSRTARSIAQELQKEVTKRGIIPKMKKPKFASEADEARWYPAHPEYAEALFEQAEREGKLGHGTMARIFGLTKPVTIRLSQVDIAKAKAQAETKGVGYQTYMKILLHKALDEAEGEVAAAKGITA
jgi:hypothetical protein